MSSLHEQGPGIGTGAFVLVMAIIGILTLTFNSTITRLSTTTPAEQEVATPTTNSPAGVASKISGYQIETDGDISYLFSPDANGGKSAITNQTAVKMVIGKFAKIHNLEIISVAPESQAVEEMHNGFLVSKIRVTGFWIVHKGRALLSRQPVETPRPKKDGI